ncbi:MAG: hypothetical protein ACO307_15205 [Ilumatobacteraceae bacterium]
MSYSSNHTNRSSIFENGDVIEGDHVKSIYDELGEDPGDILSGIGVPYRASTWWNAARTFTTSAVTAAGTLSLWPMVLVRATTFDRIGTYVDTTAGAASTVVRLGIYNSDANGMPSTLVSGSETTQDGTVVNSATVAGSTISVSLGRGRYYLAAVSQGSGTMPTTARGNGSWCDVNYGNSTNFTNIMSGVAACFGLTGVTGALTADLTGSAFTNQSVGHSVAVRMV